VNKLAGIAWKGRFEGTNKLIRPTSSPVITATVVTNIAHIAFSDIYDIFLIMTQDPQVKDLRVAAPQAAGVRFNLKKKSFRGKKLAVNLSSYNSDFLDGIFADVASVSDSTEACGKRASTAASDEDWTASLPPSKKSRPSMQNSLSRVPMSARNLSLLAKSPKGINEFFGTHSSNSQANDCLESPGLKCHQDSLQFQLSCVSNAFESSCGQSAGLSMPTVGSAATLAFPNLPATVSDSSCHAGLTRVKLVRQASVPEKPNKESFGWFVDLDEHLSPESNYNLPYTVSSDSLAFQAPTAPKAVNDHEELEWAQAADTVDDVLGDFF
jgi:hypothetical protein